MKNDDNFELHLATIWENISDLIPNELACISGDDKKTWAEYEKISARIANFLNERGVTKDTKVGLYLFNCNEYLTSQFATMKVMGVPINVNYRYQSDELVYLFDNSDSEVVFFHESYLDQVKQVYKKLPNGVSASKGFVILNKDETHEQFLKRAHDAMYQAKLSKNSNWEKSQQDLCKTPQ